MEEGKFNARVIQRELAMITHLMTEENFENVKRDDGKPLNVSRARTWFEVIHPLRNNITKTNVTI